MLLFYGHFCAQCRLNGPSDPKGNEARLKMKHPSDIARPGFEPRCYRSVANHATTVQSQDSVFTVMVDGIQKKMANVRIL